MKNDDGFEDISDEFEDINSSTEESQDIKITGERLNPSQLNKINAKILSSNKEIEDYSDQVISNKHPVYFKRDPIGKNLSDSGIFFTPTCTNATETLAKAQSGGLNIKEMLPSLVMKAVLDNTEKFTVNIPFAHKSKVSFLGLFDIPFTEHNHFVNVVIDVDATDKSNLKITSKVQDSKSWFSGLFSNYSDIFKEIKQVAQSFTNNEYFQYRNKDKDIKVYNKKSGIFGVEYSGKQGIFDNKTCGYHVINKNTEQVIPSDENKNIVDKVTNNYNTSCKTNSESVQKDIKGEDEMGKKNKNKVEVVNPVINQEVIKEESKFRKSTILSASLFTTGLVGGLAGFGLTAAALATTIVSFIKEAKDWLIEKSDLFKPFFEFLSQQPWLAPVVTAVAAFASSIIAFIGAAVPTITGVHSHQEFNKKANELADGANKTNLLNKNVLHKMTHFVDATAPEVKTNEGQGKF